MSFCCSWQACLQLLQQSVEKTAPTGNLVNVVRHDVFQGFKRAIARKSFNPLAKLDIQFVDEDNISEGAVDEGGPKREFLLSFVV